MADGANNKLAQVRTKDNLKRDAEVGKRNKAGVGKRTANVGGGGSLPINRGMNVARTMGNLSSNSTQQDIEAKKRLNRANRAIQIAEKIPYINKYAKVVKKATQAAEKVQNVKGGIGSFFKGSSDNAPSAEDIKEAQEAEERGEEYDPEAKEKRQTAITKRQTIILTVLISSGLLISILFLGVILMSSMTDTGGKYYLASKENPSEEDLEKSYNSQDGNNSSSSDSSSSSTSIKGLKRDSLNNLIYVGDSRTVGLCTSVEEDSSGCSNVPFTADSKVYIAKVSMGYGWFESTAYSLIESQLNSNPNSTVFINMGTNDLSDADKYASKYNDLASKYTKANIIAVSVTQIDDSKASDNGYSVKNSQVVDFNKTLKGKISSSVSYCDVYSSIDDNYDTTDGVHYTSDTYKKINQAMNDCIK